MSTREDAFYNYAHTLETRLQEVEIKLNTYKDQMQSYVTAQDKRHDELQESHSAMAMALGSIDIQLKVLIAVLKERSVLFDQLRIPAIMTAVALIGWLLVKVLHL